MLCARFEKEINLKYFTHKTTYFSFLQYIYARKYINVRIGAENSTSALNFTKGVVPPDYEMRRPHYQLCLPAISNDCWY